MFRLNILLLIIIAAGCNQPANENAAPADADNLATTAVLVSAEGLDVEGEIKVEPVSGGVSISGVVDGLPEGVYGLHVHTNPDCSDPDFKSAGGHYNPLESPHGSPDQDSSNRHVGDIGNITAIAGQRLTFNFVDQVASLSGPTSIQGRPFVIHEGADDFSSQPSGAAGRRIACGVLASN